VISSILQSRTNHIESDAFRSNALPRRPVYGAGKHMQRAGRDSGHRQGFREDDVSTR